MFKILWLVFCKITLRQHRKHLSCCIPWSQVLTKGSGYMHVYANLEVSIRLSVLYVVEPQQHFWIMFRLVTKARRSSEAPFSGESVPSEQKQFMWYVAPRCKISKKIHIYKYLPFLVSPKKESDLKNESWVRRCYKVLWASCKNVY